MSSLGSRIRSVVVVCTLSPFVASAQVTRICSVSTSGAQGNLDCRAPSVSSDGRYVAFETQAVLTTSPDPSDSGLSLDVYVNDRLTGRTVCVSVDGDRIPRGGDRPVLSGNGRLVVFESASSLLLPPGIDMNGTVDIFLHDRDADGNGVFDEQTPSGESPRTSTVRVSVASDGSEAHGDSLVPTISADGSHVAFVSDASDLVSGDTNGFTDIFVRNLAGSSTVRASITPGGGEADENSGWDPNRANNPVRPSLTGDGRLVAFVSWSTNLTADTDLPSPGVSPDADVFVHDVVTLQSLRVSIPSGSSGDPNGQSGNFGLAISEQGGFVIFQSNAPSLDPATSGSPNQIYVRDLSASTTRRVSVSSSSVSSNGECAYPTISADGRFVAFRSDATNLVSGDTANYDVFVHDRNAAGCSGFDQTGCVSTSRVSKNSVGEAGNNGSGLNDNGIAISSSGQFIALESFASNLVLGDTNGREDVFLHDRAKCGTGNVDALNGQPATVLTINGGTGVVVVPRNTAITIQLTSAPSGPAGTDKYAVWVWNGIPSNQLAIDFGGTTIGCLVNPSPLNIGGSPVINPQPQPIRCIVGAGIGSPEATVCLDMSANQIIQKPAVPWMINTMTPNGQGDFTLQGIIRDNGAGTSGMYSCTNAVVLRVP